MAGGIYSQLLISVIPQQPTTTAYNNVVVAAGLAVADLQRHSVGHYRSTGFNNALVIRISDISRPPIYKWP